MRHFVSLTSSCCSPSNSSSLAPLRRSPLMNFPVAHSALQACRSQFHSHSETDIPRCGNAPLGAGGGGGAGGGLADGIGAGMADVGGGGEERVEDSGCDHEEEQQKRGEREERGWGERRAGREGWRNGAGGGEAQSSSSGSPRAGSGCDDMERWRRGGTGDGRVTTGRGRGGRAWLRRDENHGRVRMAGGGEIGPYGRMVRSPHRFDEHRYWCRSENELPGQHDKFVLVSYNILADKNAAEHYYELYRHIPWRLIRWELRKTKLVAELDRWAPDIMCLQEVDGFEDLREEFERRGYRGAYKGRTGGALDGCAIFWRTTRFQLLQEESIQFNELGLRDNVAQLCVFQSIAGLQSDLQSTAQLPNSGKRRNPGNVVIVGNIHVLFNPKRGDIKLGQVRVLLESAHALSGQWGDAPVILAGDFNSTPMSDIYKFLATSELDISDINRAKMSGQAEAPMPWTLQAQQFWHRETLPTNEMEVIGSHAVDVLFPVESSPGTDSPNKILRNFHWTPEERMAATGTLDCTILRHNLNLRSAYSQIKGEFGCRDAQGEPLVTTFHRQFMGTVDYIWHTEGIDTLKVLDTIPVNVLQRSQGLPSQKWGSDHLALACELTFLSSAEPDESLDTYNVQ